MGLRVWVVVHRVVVHRVVVHRVVRHWGGIWSLAARELLEVED